MYLRPVGTRCEHVEFVLNIKYQFVVDATTRSYGTAVYVRLFFLPTTRPSGTRMSKKGHAHSLILRIMVQTIKISVHNITVRFPQIIADQNADER